MLMTESLCGVDAALQYRHMFNVPCETCVYVLRDQRNTEAYHCTCSKEEIDTIKASQPINKAKVRTL